MTYDLITKHDSRNFTPGPSVPAVYGRRRTIDSITIHWWGLPEWNATFDGTVSFLCTNTKPTSAHEVIEAGRVAVLVAHGDASWAAGNAVGNATSIHLELNPRGSDGDYATAAERIRDIREMHGKDLPLIPHRDWQATMCPGHYDLARLDRMSRDVSTITTQSATITPTPEEDELAFTISELLNTPAYDNGPTISQVLKNLDDNEVTRYIKGDKSETLYDVTDDGKLRPIILAEWQATGRPYRTLPQVIINALPKTA